MLVIIYDTETSGLPDTWDKIVTKINVNKWPYIMQLSYIILDTETNEIVDVYDTIVSLSDDIVISEKSIEMHNITRERSQKEGRPIAEVLQHFFEAVKKCDLIIGHNLNFDLNMVCAEVVRNAELKQFATLLITKKKFCTMKESTAFCCLPSVKDGLPNYNRLKYPRLAELYEKLFNETPSGLHNSLYDVIATARCFMKLRYDRDIGNTKEKESEYN